MPSGRSDRFPSLYGSMDPFIAGILEMVKRNRKNQEGFKV